MRDQLLPLIPIVLISITAGGAQAGVIEARAVAFSGQRAPGTSDGVNFDDGYAFFPSIFESGKTEFLAYLTGPSVNENNDAGIWTDSSGTLTLVAREGDPAPGTEAGVVFEQILQHQSSATGNIALRATLTGPGVDASNDVGVWSYRSGALELVARTGLVAPGADGAIFAGFEEFLINSVGQVAFIAALSGPAVNDTNNSGIWSESGGTLGMLTRGGLSHAPGTQRLPFRRFHFIALNQGGQCAFSATLTGSGSHTSGIWVGTSALTEVAVASEFDPAGGTPAPGAALASFRNLISPIEIDSSGGTAFFADLAGAGVDQTNDSGIWSNDGGGSALVAREGDVAPGTAAGTVFDDFERSIQPAAPSRNDRQIVFSASVRGPAVGPTNDQAIWTKAPGREPLLIARTGDAAPETDGALFFGLGYPSCNDAGQVVFSAVLARGTAGETDLAILRRDADGRLRPVVKDDDQARVSGSLQALSGVGLGGGEATGGQSGRSMAVNNGGQVVFTAFLADGRRGVFVTPAAESVDDEEMNGDTADDPAQLVSAQCGACGAGLGSLWPAMLLGLAIVKVVRRSRRELGRG